MELEKGSFTMTKLFHFILTFVYFIPNVMILSLLCLEIVIKEALENVFGVRRNAKPIRTIERFG